MRRPRSSIWGWGESVKTKGDVARKVGREAREVRAQLGSAEFAARCHLTEDEMAMLDKLCTCPPRNAAAALAALKLKIEYAYGKPVQQVEHSGDVTITVSDPYAVPENEA